jgi:hypothetical protein
MELAYKDFKQLQDIINLSRDLKENAERNG